MIAGNHKTLWKQVRLRPLTPEDTGFMIQLVSNPETTRFLPGMITDEVMMEEWIRSLKDSDNELIISCDDIPVGECSLTVSGTSAEIGLMLLPQYWRQGIGTVVVRQLLSLADTRGIGETTAVTDAGNEAAIALLEKAGFQRKKIGWMLRITDEEDLPGQNIIQFVWKGERTHARH